MLALQDVLVVGIAKVEALQEEEQGGLLDLLPVLVNRIVVGGVVAVLDAAVEVIDWYCGRQKLNQMLIRAVFLMIL